MYKKVDYTKVEVKADFEESCRFALFDMSLISFLILKNLAPGSDKIAFS